jgi:hypothetical protein
MLSHNWLAVALSALMKIERQRKPWLRAEILRRLATQCQENASRKLLLINCAEAYLPLEGDQEAEYLRLLREEPLYQEVNSMIITTYDQGIKAGQRKALQEMVIRLASRRYGAPNEISRTTLLAIEDIARLENLVETATTAQSWQQLMAGN